MSCKMSIESSIGRFPGQEGLHQLLRILETAFSLLYRGWKKAIAMLLPENCNIAWSNEAGHQLFFLFLPTAFLSTFQ